MGKTVSALKESTSIGIKANEYIELTNPNNGNVYHITRLIEGASFTTYRASDNQRCHLKILDY